MLLDSDWIRLSDQVSEEWADHLTETLDLIGSTQREGARLSGEEENPVNVDEVFKNTVKWLSATTNSIDNEDAKVIERVSIKLQNSMFSAMLYCLCSLLRRNGNAVRMYRSHRIFTISIFCGIKQQEAKKQTAFEGHYHGEKTRNRMRRAAQNCHNCDVTQLTVLYIEKV